MTPEAITSGVKRHRRAAAVAMATLLMRTALPHFDESENRKYRNHLARVQYRNTGHSGDNNRLRTCELCFKPGLTVAKRDHYCIIREEHSARAPLSPPF